MADERPERCERCRYWGAGDEHPDCRTRECLRLPPRPPATAAQEDFARNLAGFESPDNVVAGLWPLTRAGDWCGEFAPSLDARGGGGTAAPEGEAVVSLGLSIRAGRVLAGLGVRTLGELAALTPLQIWEARGAGNWAVGEIVIALAQRGLSLRPEPRLDAPHLPPAE
jgi:hypothetical protein